MSIATKLHNCDSVVNFERGGVLGLIVYHEAHKVKSAKDTKVGKATFRIKKSKMEHPKSEIPKMSRFRQRSFRYTAFGNRGIK